MATRKRVQSNRGRVLDRGLEAFLVRGFHGSGLKEILDEAEIPKGSFYNYFESKEEFGAAVIDHYASTFARLMRERFSHSRRNGLAQLRDFFQGMTDFFAEARFERGCLVGNLAAEVAETSEECRRALQAAVQSWKTIFEEVIRRGQKDGSIRKDVAAGALADFIINSWEGSLLRMKIEKSAKPLEECREILFRVLLPA